MFMDWVRIFLLSRQIWACFSILARLRSLNTTVTVIPLSMTHVVPTAGCTQLQILWGCQKWFWEMYEITNWMWNRLRERRISMTVKKIALKWNISRNVLKTVEIKAGHLGGNFRWKWYILTRYTFYLHQSQIQTEKRQEKKDPSHTDFKYKGDLQIVD